MEFQRPTNIIPTPWADQGTYETIPATQVSSGRASWDAGFPLENTIPVSSGGIPANYNDFQGVLHDLSEHTCYQQTGGLYAWTSSIDYPVGAIVQGGDAKTYQAVTKNGPNTSVVNPTTDSSGSYWDTFVMAGGSQTIKGAKTFTSSTVFSSGITVSGTISGTATSATSAGSATNASSLGGIAASGYVTTSGAQTITGAKTFSNAVSLPMILRSVDNGECDMLGSTDFSKGGAVVCYGQDNTITPGAVLLRPCSSGTAHSFLANPDGTLTWDGKGFVYDSGDQTISGKKTINDVLIKNGTLAYSDTTSGGISIHNGSSAADGAGLWTYGKSHASRPGWAILQTNLTGSYLTVCFNGSFWGPLNNTIDLGANSTNNRWKNTYLQTNPNVSSDERIKTSISNVPDAVLDAWHDVQWLQFQMRDAIAEKGEEKARLHNGMIAQRINEAFAAHGLDAARYGLFCHDEWDAKPAEINEEGHVVEEARSAGDLYSLRYEECLCMEAAYQRRRANRAEARISILEQRLNELEAVLASLISPVQSEEPVMEQEPVVEEPTTVVEEPTTVEESTDTEQEPEQENG